MEKPVILLGGADLSLPKFNGGTKYLNLLVKLLQDYDYESYLITKDGTFESWLVEHQPVISSDLAKSWAKQGRKLKSMCVWLPVAKYFLELTKQVYFFDAEITRTAGPQFPMLKDMLSNQIRAIATNNQYNVNWYKSTINYPTMLINEWSDAKYWNPKPEIQEKNLVGYTKEPSSDAVICAINDICQKQGLKFKFVKIEGLNEQDVINLMRRCDFFLGTNPGKHPVHGEGCPRAGNEAMHAGCVVISFDVNGNREYLRDEKTGFLIPRKRSDLMANKLIYLVKHPDIKEQIREASTHFALERFSAPGRWEKIRDFLELK